MFAHERLQTILQLLDNKQRLTVQELQKKLRISPATLRRDLAELEHQNKVVRVHGGILHRNVLIGEPTFDQKLETLSESKKAMSQLATDLVTPKSTVFIDAGTSCLEVGLALGTRTDLTIITNSISLLQRNQTISAKLICIGGEIRGISQALIGSEAIRWLEKLHVDYAFIGASGLSSTGASTTELHEATVKQRLCEHAKLKILVADAAKWEKPSSILFGHWQEFDYFITSDEFPQSARRKLEKSGVKVIQSQPKGK